MKKALVAFSVVLLSQSTFALTMDQVSSCAERDQDLADLIQILHENAGHEAPGMLKELAEESETCSELRNSLAQRLDAILFQGF
jgi:hypothetical protein